MEGRVLWIWLNKDPRSLALKAYGLGITKASIQAKFSVMQKHLGGSLYDLHSNGFRSALGSRGKISDENGFALRDKMARAEGDGI